MSTTDRQQATQRVSYQLETLWDSDYEPTHEGSRRSTRRRPG
jgi:hypothetical protein